MIGGSGSDTETTDGHSRPRDGVDVLIVGPAGHRTGGIAHYIDRQDALLTDPIRTRVYDTATPARSLPSAVTRVVGDSRAQLLDKVVRTVLGLCRFPFRRRPDVVHVHASQDLSFLRAGVYALLAAAVWRCGIVFHVHGPTFDEFVAEATPPMSWFQSLVVGRCDRIVVLSDYWADALARRVPRGRTVVLPNAIEHDAYEPRYDADPPRLVFISNLYPRKGVTDLFTAIERLAADGVDFEAVVAGDGPLREDAAELAATHDNVSYRGYVSEAEKRRLLSSGTVSVLASHAEGLPFALLEGMGAGNAIVATRVGSVPETVDADGGRLVDPGDVDALADALRELLTDPDRATEMGRHNRALAVERYSWDSVTASLTELYGDVLAERSNET
jgi:glycosyltransferase involved in cell wall biosynthesis